MPNEYWAKAAKAAVYLGNQTEHSHIQSKEFETLHKAKPSLAHTRIFGCLVQALVLVEIRKKLDNRMRELVFIGYTETSSIWRLLDRETGRVHRSRDVAFKENEFPFLGPLAKPQEATIINQTPLHFVPTMQDSGDEAENEISDIAENTRKRTADIATQGELGLEDGASAPKRRFAVGREDLSIDMNWQPAEDLSAARSTRSRIADAANATIAREDVPRIIDCVYMATEGPRTYEDAMGSEHAERWKEAFKSEMSSLKEHQVFGEVVSGEDERVKERIVDGKFVLSIKHNVDGTPGRYKARLIARGFTQRPEDYGEITAPVVDATAIRYSLGYAAKHDLEIATLDVPTAYLGATLTEEVYLRLPDADWKSFGIQYAGQSLGCVCQFQG